MGILESITHKKEIEETLQNAKSLYDGAKSEYEEASKKAEANIKLLGEQELKAWGNDIHNFIITFSMFANAEESKYVPNSSKLICCNNSSKNAVIELKNTSFQAKEMLKMGTLAIGTSAIAGIAAYGAVSTLTASAVAKGIAVSAATKGIIIGGAIVAPLLLFGAVFVNLHAKKKLAEAKELYAEAEKYAADLDLFTIELKAISSMSIRYMRFISQISKIMNYHINKMCEISKAYPKDYESKVDYDLLTKDEKKLLHVSWLLASIYSALLKSPLIGDDGKLNKSAATKLIECKHDLKLIKKDIPKSPKAKKIIALVIFLVILSILSILAIILINVLKQ